jgi:type IV secretory pathway TraG/TraD family ATPase VirD4
MQRPTTSDRGTDTALVAIAAAMVCGGLLWVSGAISAVVSGDSWPTGHPAAGLVALAHFSHTSAAWGQPVGPAWLYWSVAGVLFIVAIAAGVGLWRLFRPAGQSVSGDPDRLPGLASRHEVKIAAGRKALLRRAATLRPSVVQPTPDDVGYRLGRARGVDCWSSVEDSMIVLGPPRSGKGLHIVIDMILDSPGAVVTTTTRPDNVTATFTARNTDGRPVAVFDPQHLAAGIPSATKWSPIRGCENPQTALIRAKALCADPGHGVENGSFWAQQCYTAVRCLLHAAALGRREPTDLYRWSLSPVAARDATEILQSHPRAAPAWGRALEAIINADPRQRDSTWAMVANTFACLSDPRVLTAVSPSEREQFAPVDFLRRRGTLYLVGTAAGASATAGLIAAFVEDLVEAARRLAAGNPGSRLDPPLALILDEAANYPLPSLPSLMSEGGGSGITTLVVLQALSQARDVWGRDKAAAIWDSAIVKIILGGGGNAEDLRDLAALIGNRQEQRTTISYGGTAGRSYSHTLDEKPILDPARLRTLPFGYGLLLLRTAAPIMMRLHPWTRRPDATTLRKAQADLQLRIRTANAHQAW